MWYKVQPYLIGMFTAREIPMLWRSKNLERTTVFLRGVWKSVLYRPVRWEYLYTSKNPLSHSSGSWLSSEEIILSLPGESIISTMILSCISPEKSCFFPSYKRVFSLVALNFGAQDQVVPFKFPFSGNYMEELHESENLMDISADREVQLEIPSNYGRIWTLKTR
jgi:maltooligosyltrehalose trehalohydrolase